MVDWIALTDRAKALVPDQNRAHAMREILADIGERYGDKWTEAEQAGFFAVGCFLCVCADIEAVRPELFASQQ